jgi:hypothetical protein
MNPPLILVITPTFNNGAKIAATVASVLSQRKGLFEFVVIDGGSTEVIGRLGKYKKHIATRGWRLLQESTKTISNEASAAGKILGPSGIQCVMYLPSTGRARPTDLHVSDVLLR